MVWWILTIICIILLILIGIFHYVYIFPANMMKKIEKDYKCLFDYSGKKQKNNVSKLDKKIAEDTVNQTEIKKPKKPKKPRKRKPKVSNKTEK